MKKIFKSSLLFAAFAVAVMSCAKNEIDTPQTDEGGYTYTFSLAGDGTKAAIGDDSIEYESGDALGVFVGETANASASVDVSTTPVTVSVTATQALKAGDVVYAYYPYASANTSASEVTMSVPVVQKQAGAAFDADAMPMVSVPYTVAGAVEAGAAQPVGDLYMNNLGAVIEFAVYGADQAGDKIHSVTFTSETALAGEFKYDLASTDLALSGLAEKSVKTAVNSSLTVGATKDAAARIYMVVAPGSYKGSIAVRTEDATYTVDVENAIAFNRSRVRPVSINLANAERQSEIKVEWLYTGLTQIRANSPAVDADGNVYMTVSKLNRVYKINNQGKKVWQFTPDFNISNGDNASSPAVEPDGSVVYAGGGIKDACLYAINGADGSQKWAFTSDKFFGNGNTPAPTFKQITPAIGQTNVYIGNTGTAGSVLAINKSTGERVSYVSGASNGTGGPAGGVHSGLGISKDGYIAWHCGYGTFVASQAEMDNPTRSHATYGSYAPWCYRYGYTWNGGNCWHCCDQNSNVAFLSIGDVNYVAAIGIERTGSEPYTYNMHFMCAPVGATDNTWPSMNTAWKSKGKKTGIKKQDQGGLCIGPRNEIIASLKHGNNTGTGDNSGTSYKGGLYAVYAETGAEAWKFELDDDVTGTAAVDKEGNIHFVTDSQGMYYIVKPDYDAKTASVIKVVNVLELAVAAGYDLGSANSSRIWSSVAINGDGKIYFAPTFHNSWKDYNGAVICLSYEGCTGPGDTPWPMKGADAARTGNQKK